jgi:hypothetical protein
LGGVKEVNRFEWYVSGGERDRRQIDVKPLFEILGVWTFVLVETFCMTLNYEIHPGSSVQGLCLQEAQMSLGQ